MRVRWLSSAALPNWSASTHKRSPHQPAPLAYFSTGLDTSHRPALEWDEHATRIYLYSDSPLRAGER